MKCPRCKTPADDGALYCLVCGKQLRRDDAFDGEFEEDFLFDEEREERERIERECEQIRTRQMRFRTLLAFGTALILTVLVALGLYVFLWSKSNRANEVIGSAQSAQDTAEETRIPALTESQMQTVQALARRLLIAGCTDYDLDVLLTCAPPAAREIVLTSLCRSYAAEDREALEEVFAELARESAYRFTEISVTLSTPYGSEELEAVRDDLTERYATTFGTLDCAVDARITCATEDGSVYQASYLFGRIDGIFYSLDF